MSDGVTGLQILDAGMRWFVALAGWGVALWGWKVRGRQTREIADNTEINRSIDACLQKIDELEQLSIDFWKDCDSKIVPAQLSSAVANCTFYTQQIAQLSPNRVFPSKAFVEVRKSITLNMEQEARGFDQQKSRISKIVRVIVRLKRQPIYEKSNFSKK